MDTLLEKLRASLSSQYTVERELGQGGMATVFLAREVRHERRVAIKVLREDLGAALGADRFKREIQIATSLTHPHILTLHDSGEAAGLLFYVMPFIDGESLRQRIDREKMLPIDQALKITQEVASALDYAHRKGIIHRDIKPANILLEDGHAIVADFGIARALSAISGEGSALTKTGTSLGTPLYMSPEQAFAERNLDGRSDLYSLACVLYEMLVGSPPFTGPNAQAVMMRHSMAEVPSMQIVRTTISAELDSVVQRALAKAPCDRFQTLAEFSHELQECVIDYHTTARRGLSDRRTAPRTPPGRRQDDEPPAKSRLRRRSTLFGSALGFAVLVAVSAWWVWGRAPSPAAKPGGGFAATRVAVLYFQDNSPAFQLGYLADGLTESLIQRLSEVKALDVISKSGVAPYRGASVGADSVARALSAGTIVRGIVEPDGSNFRVRVRLINGNTGETMAEASFGQPQSDVIAAQDSLAARVAAMLRANVGAEVALREARARTSNAMAWTLFQRALRVRKDAEAQASRSDTTGAENSFSAADSMFLAASSMDNSWHEPIVARSSLHLARARMVATPSRASRWIERGLEQAQQVIANNSRDAAAVEMRGSLRYLKWSYSLAGSAAERTALLNGAEEDLKKSVEIDPTRAGAWSALSTVYSQKNEIINAKTAAQRAYEEDAYLAGTDGILWKLYASSYDLQQFEEAARYCNDGAKRFPDNPRFVRCRLWLLTVQSLPAKIPQAWADYSRLQQLSSARSWKLGQLEGRMLIAAGLARSNLRDSALKVLSGARADPADDTDGEMMGLEAFIRTLFGTAQDTTEAIKILSHYLRTHPEHRAGFSQSQSWWWKGLKEDGRLKALLTETP